MRVVKETTSTRERESARQRAALQRLAHCVTWVLVCVCAACLFSSDARAQSRPSIELQWKESYREPGWADGASIVALQASTAAIVFGVGSDREPFFEGPWPLDDEIQEPILGSTEADLGLLSGISDGFWYGLLGWSILIEPWLVDYAIWDAPDVAVRVFVVNVHTLSLAAFISTMQQYFVRRERPPTLECRASADDPPACTDREIVGFPSGHFLMSSTAATLTCLNGDEFGHYGTPAGYWIACLGTAAAAMSVGVLRISANAHYPSDTIAGGLMGVTIGYLFPKLLYYRSSEGDSPNSTIAFPWVGGNAGGFMLHSTW